MLQHGASQILGQALDVPTRFNVARQQAEERADGRVLVLGIDTGNDDFAAPQVERELAADIDTERLTDGLGQRDLAFGGERGDFVDGRHGDSPDYDV